MDMQQSLLSAMEDTDSFIAEFKADEHYYPESHSGYAFSDFVDSEKVDSSLDEDPNDSLTSQTLNTDGTPKRPMNAFMIFARRRRPQISAENQTMRTGEISKILSREWNSMGSNEKKFYLDQAKQLKDNFNSKYPDYVYRRRPNNSRRQRKTDSGGRFPKNPIPGNNGEDLNLQSDLGELSGETDESVTSVGLRSNHSSQDLGLLGVSGTAIPSQLTGGGFPLLSTETALQQNALGDRRSHFSSLGRETVRDITAARSASNISQEYHSLDFSDLPHYTRNPATVAHDQLPYGTWEHRENGSPAPLPWLLHPMKSIPSTSRANFLSSHLGWSSDPSCQEVAISTSAIHPSSNFPTLNAPFYPSSSRSPSTSNYPSSPESPVPGFSSTSGSQISPMTGRETPSQPLNGPISYLPRGVSPSHPSPNHSRTESQEQILACVVDKKSVSPPDGFWNRDKAGF